MINYSINSPNVIDWFFLRFIRLTTRAKIILTCHDVLPLSNISIQRQMEVSIKRKIFNIADFILVHNENSFLELEKEFSIKAEKIIMHPFPIMDLAKLNLNVLFNGHIYDYAFIGHLRENKGLDILLQAWKLMFEKNPNAKLLIAGNIPDDQSFLDDINLLKKYNIDFHFAYLSDEEYLEKVLISKTIILPYRHGSNSGVIYNLVNLPVNIIYSNIPMFTSNPILSRAGSFESGSVLSLLDRLLFFYSNVCENRGVKINEYESDFRNQIKKIYSILLYEKNT